MPTPNPTTRREYRGAAAATTLQNSMSSSDTSFVLVAASNWPTGAVGKFVVTVNRGQADEEKILCDTQSSRTVSCLLANRGFDGTTAQGHAAGATVECTISAFDADEWNQHTNASTAVHGVAGAVVGTTDAQTLTNKTLDSPAFTGNPLTFAKAFFHGYLTVGVNVTTASWTLLTWGGVQQTSFAYASGSHVAAPVSGYYLVSAGVLWASNATGARALEVRVNSAGSITGGTGIINDSRTATAVASPNPTSGGSTIVHLVAGDYVEMFVYQDSGGTLSATATDQFTHLDLSLVSV